MKQIVILIISAIVLLAMSRLSAQTDTCALTTLPYTYDFNDVSTVPEYPFPSACWQRSMSNFPKVEYGHLSFFSNFTSIGIMPPIDTSILNIQDLQISFYAGNTSSYGIEVGVMTNPSDTSTFTKVRFVKAVTNDFQHFVIPLSSYTGGGRYIAFRFVRVPDTYNSIYVDDILLDTIPDCQQPSALAATAVTPYSVDLSWVGYNPDNPDYTVYFRKDGETEWQYREITVSSPAYTLDGLAWAYCYDIYVESACANEPSNTLRVSTSCSPISSVPQFWDFEANNTSGGSAAPLPACWNRYTDFFDYPHVAGGFVLSGSHSLGFSPYDDYGYAILPPVNTDSLSISDLQLSFYGRQGDFAGSIEVGVMGNPYNPSSFTLLETIPLTTAFQPYDIPLSTYGGSGTYIALRDVGRCFVDDVALVPIPQCARPMGLSAGATTPVSVVLSWDSVSDSTRYVIHYKPTGENGWMTDTTTTPGLATYLLSGLLPSTQYQIYVTANCNPYSKSNTITVKTLCSVIATVPQYWDFEENNTAGTAAEPLPECWSRTAAHNPYVRTHNFALSGSNLLFFEHNTSYVSLPPIDTTLLDIQDLQLTFYARIGSDYSFDCQVGVMSDPTNAATFVSIDTLTRLNNTFQVFDIPLSDYTGDGLYITIRFYSSAYYQVLWLDDMTLTRTPDCPRPADLEAVDVQGRSVRLNWNHTVDTARYFIHYKADNDSVWHTIATGLLDTTTYTLQGLLPLTQYQCRIDAECYPGGFSNTVSFTTPCGGISSVPQFWDFESENSGGNGTFPICWYRTGSSNSYYLPAITGVFGYYAHSGTHVITSRYGNTFVVLPPIWEDSLDINNLQLTFYVSTFQNDFHLVVGVLDNPTDTSTFIPVQQLTVYGPEEYQRYTIPFSGYSGAGTYIAIRFDGTLTYLDDITLDKIPNCPEPSNLKVDSIYTTSVQFSWVGFDSLSPSYECYYKSVNETEWSSVPFTATIPQFTLTGLYPSTSYEAYLVSDCLPDMPSNYVKFTTECVAITTLPQTWDFEYHNVLSNNNMPDCYGRYFTNHSPDNYNSLPNHSLHLTLVYDYFRYHPVVVLPQINTDSLDINQLQLSFQIRTSEVPVFPMMLEIGVSNVPEPWNSSTDSITVVQTISNIPLDYQQYDIPFTSYSGSGSYITLRAVTSSQMNGSCQVFLDNVVLDTIPDCQRPSNFTIQQLSETAITINWIGHNAEHLDYTLYYRPTGDTVWFEEHFTTTAPSYTLANLHHSTEYELFMVNDCDTSKHSELLTFSTLCGDIAQVPYAWDFESNNTAYPTQYVLPACWNRNSSSYPYVIEESQVQERGRMLYFSNNNPSTVVLPRINTDSLLLNNLQISFAAMATEDYDYNEFNWATLTIGVMSHPDSADSFVPVYQITEFTNDFQDYSIPFADYTGMGSYIAIRNAGSYHTFTYLDDLVLDTIPACPRPSALSASHPTAHTVTLHWTGYDETHGQILLKYREVGDSVWMTNTIAITGNTFVMSGLTPATSYEVCVAAVCNPTLLSNVIVVSTTCEAISTLPQLWGFEANNTAGTNVDPLPECWSRTGDHYPSVVENNATNLWAYTGTHYLKFLNSAKSTVVLPAIDTIVLQISDLMITFHAKTSNASDNNRLLIGLMSDPTDTSTFVAVDTVSGFTTEYQEFDVPLSAYTGSNTHIGIRTFGSASNTICMDNLQLQLLPDCSRPSDISLAQVGMTSATLVWSHDADSTRYVIMYKPVGSDTALYDTTDILISPTATLTGLASNTTYEVRVMADCYPGAYSTPFMFTTLCDLIDSLPAFWDFEENNTGGTSSYPFPACWGRLTSGSNNHMPYVYESTDYSYSGSKALNFWISQGWYVFMPPLSENIPANHVGMSFYLKCHTSNTLASLAVGVMTDPNDISSFVAIDTVTGMTVDYQLVDLDLSAYNGNGRFIAFRDISVPSSYTDIYIDNLTLDLVPACPRPSLPTILYADSRSADVMWIHNADSATYVVCYRPVGDTLWQTDTVGVTILTIDDLQPSTTYELCVIALCSPNTPSETVTFATECAQDIISVPQTWGFEDATQNEMQPCWSRIVGSNASAQNYPRVENFHPQSGNKSLCFWRSEGSMAIMPYVNSDYLDIHTLQISFYIYNQYGDQYAGASLEVGVMTDPTDPATFTLVQTLDSLKKAFVYVTIPFNTYMGNGTYIAFRDPNPNPDSYSGYFYDIYIDSLTIDLNHDLPCAMPSQLTITDVTDSSAVVTWQNEADWFDGEVTYLVYYKPTTEVVWQTDTVAAGQNTHILTGLDTLTMYDCYVVAMCNPDSPSDTAQFTTLVSDSTGIRPYDQDATFDIVLYPNPAREYVDIHVTDENVRILGIEVYDIYGKVVRSVVGTNNDSSLQTTRISLSGLAAGVYIAHVRTESGIIDLKFIKQR